MTSFLRNAGWELAGSLCESILQDAARDICGKQAKFKKRTARMVDEGMISGVLKATLDDLWDARNREHLFLLEEWEYNKYTLKLYNDAIRTLRALCAALDAYFKNLKVPF